MPVSVVSPDPALSGARLGGRAAPLRAAVREALALEGRRAGEVAVVLADDARLRDLNRRWRGLDRTTDVLSFGYDEGGDAEVDGDIVVSLERVRAQARRFRVGPGRELARVVVHGALHLAGLDHEAAGERRRMRAREDRVLRGLREAITELDAALGTAAGARAKRAG